MDEDQPIPDKKPRERPLFCSCGTRLVEDAVFCHRCGKPVFDMPEVETAPAMAFPRPGAEAALPSVAGQATAAQTTAVPPPPSRYQGPPEPIDLRNRMAVQIAFFVAVFEFPLISFAGLFPMHPLVLSAMVLALGGFFAVFLYQQRAQCRLGTLNGFRLGWISGLLLFLLLLVFGALQFAFFTFSGGNLMAQLEQVMAASGAAAMPAEQQQVLREVFGDWSKLFIVLLVALFLLFLFLTACAGVGGALGARSRVGEPRSHEASGR
jgi:hypothetical protein